MVLPLSVCLFEPRILELRSFQKKEEKSDLRSAEDQNGRNKAEDQGMEDIEQEE